MLVWEACKGTKKLAEWEAYSWTEGVHVRNSRQFTSFRFVLLSGHRGSIFTDNPNKMRVIYDSRKMELHGCKTHLQHFPLLDLPFGIICNIFSWLPVKNILLCKLICKMLLKLLEDPCFVQIHLSRAGISTTSLILHENRVNRGKFHFFTFDIGEAAFSSCSSTADQDFYSYYPHRLRKLENSVGQIGYISHTVNVIGSCNGILCYMDKPLEPSFYLCNPVLSEFLKLPSINTFPPVYTYANHSGFGYCPRTKQYKIICFMCMTPTSVNAKMMMAVIHTLGSDSWRKIDQNVPCPKRDSFDPLLNGALHWITDSSEPFELITSFDLDKENFRFVSPPAHFTRQYINKVSWINIGVLWGCLCACYIYEDTEFKVWVMKEYGVRESWTKEFSIDLKFYCNLKDEDLHQPIKFLSNGDLWLLSSSGSLVSFSPKKKTFRELRQTGHWRIVVYAHDLSFLSLKDVTGAKSLKMMKYHARTQRFISEA